MAAKRWRHRRRSKQTGLAVFPLYRLFPNLVTMLALCAGLSAIRFAWMERWEYAVILIIAAAFLDGIDGRLARLLNATSNLGAQLDSLADFLNFGVAPALVLYQWNLHEIGGIGWGIALFYTICAAIRLARFNANLDDKAQKVLGEVFFFGIPSPSAAGLSLLPIILSFLFAEKYDEPLFDITPWMTAIFTAIIAVLMVSRLPTFAAKKLPIKREIVPLALAASALFVIALVLEPWVTLPLMGIVYLLGLPISAATYYWRFHSKKKLP
jgi:CDP-diacylglycerol--serine O-phosphatidyltransferase